MPDAVGGVAPFEPAQRPEVAIQGEDGKAVDRRPSHRETRDGAFVEAARVRTEQHRHRTVDPAVARLERRAQARRLLIDHVGAVHQLELRLVVDRVLDIRRRRRAKPGGVVGRRFQKAAVDRTAQRIERFGGKFGQKARFSDEMMRRRAVRHARPARALPQRKLVDVDFAKHHRRRVEQRTTHIGRLRHRRAADRPQCRTRSTHRNAALPPRSYF